MTTSSTSESNDSLKSQFVPQNSFAEFSNTNQIPYSPSQDLYKLQQQQQQQKTTKIITTTSSINFEEAEAAAAQSLLQSASSTTSTNLSYSYMKGRPIPAAVQSRTSTVNLDVQVNNKRGSDEKDKEKEKEKKARISTLGDVVEGGEVIGTVDIGEGSPFKTSNKRAAQNRLAQKTFREKKEDYIRELEAKARQLDELLSTPQNQVPLPFPNSSIPIPIPLVVTKPTQSLLPVVGSHILAHTKEELESSWQEEKKTLLLQREIERQGFAREKLMWIEVVKGLKIELEELRSAGKNDRGGNGDNTVEKS